MNGKRKYGIVIAQTMLCTFEVEAEDAQSAETVACARLDRILEHVSVPVMPHFPDADFAWGEGEVIDTSDREAETERLREDFARQTFEIDGETGERFLAKPWFGFPAGTAKRVIAMWLRGGCSWEEAYRLATM